MMRSAYFIMHGDVAMLRRYYDDRRVQSTITIAIAKTHEDDTNILQIDYIIRADAFKEHGMCITRENPSTPPHLRDRSGCFCIGDFSLANARIESPSQKQKSGWLTHTRRTRGTSLVQGVESGRWALKNIERGNCTLGG